ncbi:MAG TPA: hypothetical protein VK213_00425 [Bacteroidales bacterium]|nr:hypothetical protein [Bacteroidales bacterium]
MKKYLPLTLIFLLGIVFLTGCEFIGGVFQTGVGVGIFIAVVILILIFFIGRIGRRR